MLIVVQQLASFDIEIPTMQSQSPLLYSPFDLGKCEQITERIDDANFLIEFIAELGFQFLGLNLKSREPPQPKCPHTTKCCTSSISTANCKAARTPHAVSLLRSRISIPAQCDECFCPRREPFPVSILERNPGSRGASQKITFF